MSAAGSGSVLDAHGSPTSRRGLRFNQDADMNES